LPIPTVQLQLTEIEANTNQGKTPAGTGNLRNEELLRTSTTYNPDTNPERIIPNEEVDTQLIKASNFRPKANVLVKSIDPCFPIASFESASSTSITTVRVATALDDIDIANLRLSVFSNFDPATRKIFCDRSCQLLATRRQRGATCIVATNSDNKTDSISMEGNSTIVGTAEISFHEFFETRLGCSRPEGSIIYITEVAVSAKHRRKGIASLILRAIDSIANTSDIETIYLHVDVTNLGAIHLYEKAGYRILADDQVFYEFTKKLNLHDGANKGRRHHLMSRDLRQPTWLNYQKHIDEDRVLGFKITSSV